MTALEMSRNRLEAAKTRLDAATAALIGDDPRKAVKECEAVFRDLRDCFPPFRHDWVALDLLLGQIVVADAWCKRRQLPAPDRLRTLLQSAVDVKLAWLAGEDE
jgi:uncharacterized protein (DUF2267 family)